MELEPAMEWAARRNHGVLITIRGDGRPQSSDIAYRVVDGRFEISVTDGRAKTANLRRDPRASLHVTRADFYAYAVIEARTEVTPVAAEPDDATVDELVEYYQAVAGDHPDWDEYRRAMVADARLILRLHPEHAYGMLTR
jgi:PPOX class probable F420-dependent enzyme